MKKTDPRSYRKEAAKLFISLLSKNDRIGIMSFGDAPTVLMPLTMNSPQNRAALISAVNGVSSKELTTDITGAVRTGFEQIRTAPGNKKVLVMLSDGKIDLGSSAKDQASFQALQQLLPELPKTDVKLFTVAFTGESDSALLEDMARKTGGFFRFAKTDKDVHVIFTSIFEKLKSPDTVPLEGDSFTIDRDVREATVIITRQDKSALTLLDPAKTKHSAVHHAANITWFASPAFDMVTIQEPAQGVWTVKLSRSEGNRVYVLTNLSLKTSFDKSFVNRGENAAISAWLEKQGGMVLERSVLETTAFFAAITGPEGKAVTIELASGVVGTDRQPIGQYSASVPVTATGEYSITLTAQGKTFKRAKTLSFKAIEPAPAPREEHKPAPAATPSPPVPPHDAGISWTGILIWFGIINLVAGVLAAGGYLFWRKRSGKGGQP